MKRCFVSLLGIAVLIWISPVFALPVLQMDIGGGYYHSTGDSRYNDETVIAGGDAFTLYALMQETNRTSLDDEYYISVALYPSAPQTSPDFGSFVFAGQTDRFGRSHGLRQALDSRAWCL